MHRESSGVRFQRLLVVFVLCVVTFAASAVRATAQDASPSPATAAGLSLEFVWETKGGPKPFVGLYDAIAAPDGSVYVIDGWADNVQVFDSDGNYLRTVGERGSGDGQFRFDKISIYGAVDRGGNLYVPDVNNQRIQKFDQEGRFLLAWGSFGTGDGQFIRPWVVAIGADDNVLVADAERMDGQWFDPSGAYLGRWGAGVPADPRAGILGQMAVDDQGHVWTSAWQKSGEDADRSLQEFDAEGRFLRNVGSYGPGEEQYDVPIDVAVDSRGYVYVGTCCGRARVLVFDPAGNIVAAWNGSEFGVDPFVEGAAADVSDDGYLYVLDGSPRLFKFRLLPPLA